MFEDISVGTARIEKLVMATNSTIPSTVSLSVGAVGATTCLVTGTVKDGHGVALKEVKLLHVYLSSDSTGATQASAPDGGFAITTYGTVVHSYTANVDVEILTTSNGIFAITLTESGTANFYVNVVNPATGSLITSSVVAFT